jgi:histone H3/H4
MDNLYAKEITKQAVIRACAGVGIKNCRAECLDVLADVVRHYIQSVGN